MRENKRVRGTQTFLSGVLVLTAANLVSKVIGLIFKIPLTNMLGNEGMGYFNTAYQIYTWLYMVSTAGLPVALSMMVSARFARRDLYSAKRVYKVALLMFLMLRQMLWQLLPLQTDRLTVRVFQQMLRLIIIRDVAEHFVWVQTLLLILVSCIH